MKCEKCGGELDATEIKYGATRCAICRDPLKGQDYFTTCVGAIAGLAIFAMAFNSGGAAVVGAIMGGLLGRLVQKYIDLKYKTSIMKDMGEINLSAAEVARKRKLENEKSR